MLTVMCIFSFYQSAVSPPNLFKAEYQSISIPKTEIRNYYKNEFQLEYSQLLASKLFAAHVTEHREHSL